MKLEKRQVIGIVIIVVLLLVLLYMIVFLGAYSTTFSPKESVSFQPQPSLYSIEGEFTPGNAAKFAVRENDEVRFTTPDGQSVILYINAVEDDRIRVRTNLDSDQTTVLEGDSEPISAADITFSLRVLSSESGEASLLMISQTFN